MTPSAAEVKFTETSDDLVAQIRPILAGKGPLLQGSVIADLFAIWLSGHPRNMQADMLKLQIDHIQRLTAMYRERH